MTDTMQMKYSAEFFAFVDQKKDDFLDFAEDYEPVKKFFAGEQKTLFDKALKLMKTYDDSKTFIVNGDIESVVKNVNDVLKNRHLILKYSNCLSCWINLSAFTARC